MTRKAGKKAIWGWMAYDWAAQPYHTLLITFIFAPYFTSSVVGDGVAGQTQWATMMFITGLIVAICSPFLGATADSIGPRKPWMAVFSIMFVLGAAFLWYATPGMESTTFILVAFGIGFMGLTFSEVFANAMLPDLTSKDEIGKLSGSGFAFGYAGGLIALFVMLLLLAENDKGVTLIGIKPILGLDPELREGTRSVGPMVAIWFMVFMIPFFLLVPETKRKPAVEDAVSNSVKQLWATIKSLPSDISLLSYLGSSMFYRDALNGLYAFGGIYAANVLGWSIVQIGIFGILALSSAALFSWIGGFVDRAIGPKKVIIISIFVLTIVCTLIVGTSRETFFSAPLSEVSTLPDRLFMICGALIGAAGGTLQAASRTMMVYQANKERMTEAFGLYALSGRATAFLAPGLVGLFTDLTQSQRLGILPIIVLFLIGLVLLVWVEPKEEY